MRGFFQISGNNGPIDPRLDPRRHPTFDKAAAVLVKRHVSHCEAVELDTLAGEIARRFNDCEELVRSARGTEQFRSCPIQREARLSCVIQPIDLVVLENACAFERTKQLDPNIPTVRRLPNSGRALRNNSLRAGADRKSCVRWCS